MASTHNRAAQIDAATLLPDTQTAVSMYRASGGMLGDVAGFGVDPLHNDPELIAERQRLMEDNMPTPEQLFGWTVNSIVDPFKQSLQFMIDQTLDIERRFL